MPSWTREKEDLTGKRRGAKEGRLARREARNEASWGVRVGDGEDAAVLGGFGGETEVDGLWTEMWVCAALPPVEFGSFKGKSWNRDKNIQVFMYARGASVALSPCLFAILYMVPLVCTRASAACIGGSGLVTSSYPDHPDLNP
jgi:hypothetical protein